MSEHNPGYRYFLRTHPIIESDPLVERIRREYTETHNGERAKDGQVRHILWRLLHERHRFETVNDAVAEWHATQTATDAGLVAPLNGLRHDWRKARATWLYSGYGTAKGDRSYWLASQRMLHWSPEKIDRYLKRPEVADHSSHVLINLNLGTRPAMAERPFWALKNSRSERRVIETLEQIIAADRAPICFLFSQEWFILEAKRDVQKMLSTVRHTIELVKDHCHIAIPCRELGDLWGHKDLDLRNSIFKTMRQSAPKLPLACHERPLCEVTAMDFRSVDGDVISLCQTGFKTPTGGRNRVQDRVTSPNGEHHYDGAAGFVRANGRRMRDRQLGGHMERHTNALGEASIPLVYRGQMWKPTRSLSNAKRRALRILRFSGASFDLSAGASIEQS
jgi:hypothetical protein